MGLVQGFTSTATMASWWLVSSLVVVMVAAVNSSPPNLIVPKVTTDTSCKCGQRFGSRIVGGTQADVNEWPWQAALVTQSRQFCGGSLINDRYVLTAAHCTDGMTASEITVLLAEHKLSNSGETELVTRSVSEIIEHSKYDDNTLVNDIALLKLESPVTVSDTVLPVCLPPEGLKYANEKAWVTGWGTTSYGGSAANVLREVKVKVWSNAQCRNGNLGDAITNKMLCAGSTGKDSCQGDSGGPLVFKNDDRDFEQIGVVSWGYGCGSEGYPGVYTRVNKYLDWIEKNTDDGVYCS